MVPTYGGKTCSARYVRCRVSLRVSSSPAVVVGGISGSGVAVIRAVAVNVENAGNTLTAAGGRTKPKCAQPRLCGANRPNGETGKTVVAVVVGGPYRNTRRNRQESFPEEKNVNVVMRGSSSGGARGGSRRGGMLGFRMVAVTPSASRVGVVPMAGGVGREKFAPIMSVQRRSATPAEWYKIICPSHLPEPAVIYILSEVAVTKKNNCEYRHTRLNRWSTDIGGRLFTTRQAGNRLVLL